MELTLTVEFNQSYPTLRGLRLEAGGNHLMGWSYAFAVRSTVRVM
jgi:hypothetical protein